MIARGYKDRASFIAPTRWQSIRIVRSSSPVRTPKLQLAAEQPLMGDCWIPPKKDTPCPKAKEKPQQDDRRGEITFRIKPHTHQRRSEGSNKNCMHQETPQRLSQTCLCLSVSCGGMGHQWLWHGLWVQHTWA